MIHSECLQVLTDELLIEKIVAEIMFTALFIVS